MSEDEILITCMGIKINLCPTCGVTTVFLQGSQERRGKSQKYVYGRTMHSDDYT